MKSLSKGEITSKPMQIPHAVWRAGEVDDEWPGEQAPDQTPGDQQDEDGPKVHNLVRHRCQWHILVRRSQPVKGAIAAILRIAARLGAPSIQQMRAPVAVR
jgi:hypothetical protein